MRNLEFVLDWCWDQDATQEEVYNRGLRERVAWVLDGFNTTILMYGQTGSGKTHVRQPASIPSTSGLL